MLRSSLARVCYVIAGCFLLAGSAEAQLYDHYWFHDPPYVDPFFNQDGTAKTTYANGYTTRPRHPGHAAHGIAMGHGLFCTHCGHGLGHGHRACVHCGGQGGSAHGAYCGQCGVHHAGEAAACASCLGGMNGDTVMGRRGPICPDITTSRLQVYVPDGYQVEINGQRTRLQTLGGIHRNSRIFTLEGLSFESAGATNVVVLQCDATGRMKRHTHTFYAQAGETYRVRFPGSFRFVGYQTPDGKLLDSGESIPPAE